MTPLLGMGCALCQSGKSQHPSYCERLTDLGCVCVSRKIL